MQTEAAFLWRKDMAEKEGEKSSKKDFAQDAAQEFFLQNPKEDFIAVSAIILSLKARSKK